MGERRTAGDWIHAIYTEDWTKRFFGLAKKAFSNITDSDSLAEDARQRLAIRLSRLDARGDRRDLTAPFVIVAFKRALVDAHRDIFGRPEPRHWLRELGDLGARLFELHCIMRLSRSEIMEALDDDSPDNWSCEQDEKQIMDILKEMDRRRECNGRTSERVSLDVTDTDGRPMLDPVDETQSPAEQAAQEQAHALRRLLFGETSEHLHDTLVERISALQDEAAHSLALDDEERFILRCFCERIPETRVGELLGGLSVRQIRYRRQTATDKLRALFSASRLSLDDLLV